MPISELRRLPKVELHVHLDCSLSFEVVQKLKPAITKEEYIRDFVAPPNCRDLVDYINKAIAAIELMQTPEQLRLVTRDIIRQFRAENVIYAEIRFAPLEHCRKGMKPTEVVQSVIDAVKEVKGEVDPVVNIILCTLRHYSEGMSMETVKLVEQFQHNGVTGFDIAADEAGYPVDNHVAAFEYAHQKGLNCTAHAGEACGPESVWETLREFKPHRIGHGVRSMEDQQLADHLREKGIHLEVCPTSNIKTKVYQSISEHNLDRIFHQEISMSINTDGRTISDVTLSEEYEKVTETFDWSIAHFLKCNLEAMDHAFASPQSRERIKKRILNAYEGLAD